MFQTQIQGSASQSRRSEPRTNVIILASLATAVDVFQVRIRNISAHGAMVEGEGLPKPGTQVRLRRGSVSVPGIIIHQSARFAGLQFDNACSIEDWSRGGHAGQAEVDRIFHEERHRYPVADKQHLSNRVVSQTMPDSEELIDLAIAIEALADMMSEDAAVISTYVDKLQVLDIAAQKLRRLARRSV